MHVSRLSATFIASQHQITAKVGKLPGPIPAVLREFPQMAEKSPFAFSSRIQRPVPGRRARSRRILYMHPTAHFSCMFNSVLKDTISLLWMM